MLLGHSLGAYFSVKFAKMYPLNVSKIIMMSPIGIPKEPNDYGKKFSLSRGVKKLVWSSNFNPVQLARAANKIGRIDAELTKYVA